MNRERQKLLFFLAAFCSVVLLFTSSAQCQCHQASQQKSSERSHPCSSHAPKDSSSNHIPTSHSQDCDCCCSLKAASAFPETAIKGVLDVTPLVEAALFVKPRSPFLEMKSESPLKPSRGSPGVGRYPFQLTSSATLSVHLQRWLI